MTVNIVLSEAIMEEMDVICSRLSSRGVENTLESAADSWALISSARKSNDIELLRAFDACYSKEFGTKYVRLAAMMLRNDAPTVAVSSLNMEAMRGYREVGNAVYRHNANTPNTSRIDDELEARLRVLALVNPSASGGISAIISERGITDPEQIMGLLEFIKESVPTLEEGVL